MDYVNSTVFWIMMVVIAIAFWAVYSILKTLVRKKLCDIEDSGRRRTYALSICVNSKTIGEIPEVKSISEKHKKSSHELLNKNGGLNMVFLGSDCKWFVQNSEHSYYVIGEGHDRSNTRIYYEQIAGIKDDDEPEWNGKGAALMITQRLDDKKGLYLSFDIMYKDHGERLGYISKEKKRIHLGEFPIPKYYDEWDDPVFDKIIEWGWKEEPHDDFFEYTDDFGETSNQLPPLTYENKYIRVQFM